MSLIKCPECGNECSSLASMCPKCGYPLELVDKESLDKSGDTSLKDAAGTTKKETTKIFDPDEYITQTVRIKCSSSKPKKMEKKLKEYEDLGWEIVSVLTESATESFFFGSAYKVTMRKKR